MFVSLPESLCAEPKISYITALHSKLEYVISFAYLLVKIIYLFSTSWVESTEFN